MRSQKLASNRASKRRRTAPGSEREMHEHFVIGGEDPKQFEALAAELEAEFKPQSAERELVVHAAGQLWRLRRATVIESAVIEVYRAERAQTDPENRKRYNEAFNQARGPLFEQLLKKDPPCEKADAAPPSEEKTEPTPKMSERDGPGEKKSAKFDLSFVREPSFQDSLCRLAQHETQLMEELSRTLRLLPRNRTKKANSAAHNLKPTMSSDRIVIGGEDAEQFEQMRADFEGQLKPQTATERELVERVACLSWRSRRPPAFEAALLEGARADFKPAIRAGAPWPIDGPDRIPALCFTDGKPTAAEREAEWKKVSAWQKGVEKRVREILGDEGREDVLSDLWFMRERDIQDQLAKMARYEAALSRQLASTHKLLHFLQT